MTGFVIMNYEEPDLPNSQLIHTPHLYRIFCAGSSFLSNKVGEASMPIE